MRAKQMKTGTRTINFILYPHALREAARWRRCAPVTTRREGHENIPGTTISSSGLRRREEAKEGGLLSPQNAHCFAARRKEHEWGGQSSYRTMTATNAAIVPMIKASLLGK